MKTWPENLVRILCEDEAILTDLQAGHLGGEALQDGGGTAPVAVGGEHPQSEVPARVEAGDEEGGGRAGDVGQGEPASAVLHLQQEQL